MLKKVTPWAIAAVVVALLAFGIMRWRLSHAAPDVTYRTAPIDKRKIIAKVTASGTLSATVTVQVGAQVSGRVASLFADYNSTVKKGQLIAKIDPQLFVAALERERANYVATKASVVKAQATQRDAEMALKRTAALNEQGLASAADLQTAQTALAVATADTDVAKAADKQELASLNTAQVNLSYTDIPSPIDGTVISRSVDVGQTVASSMTAPVLFTIAEDLRKMQVHTSVAEGDVGRLEANMDAWFTVDAFPGRRFRGKISQIRNAATTVQNVVTYDAVIDVENNDLKLRPGMTATTTINYAEKDDVLAIPNSALRFKPPTEAAPPPPSAAASLSSGTPATSASVVAAPAEAGSAKAHGRKQGGDEGKKSGAKDAKTIYVLRDGRPEAVPITIGLSDGTSTEVVAGDLKEGDLVIVEANVGGKPAATSASGGGAPRMGRMF